MDKLVPLGKIVKPHGAEGFLKIQPLSDINLKDKFIFIELEGAPVPFFVIQHQVDGLSLIMLEEIDNKELATQLSGKKIFISESELEKVNLEDEEWLPMLAGFQLFDQNKFNHGMIEEVLEYPSQILARIGDQLIPLHEDLILKIDPKKKTIQMNLPEGLFS